MNLTERRRARILASLRELHTELGRGVTQQELVDHAVQSRHWVRKDLAVLAEQGLVQAPPGRRRAIKPIVEEGTS